MPIRAGASCPRGIPLLEINNEDGGSFRRRAGGLVCNVNGSVETGVGNLANLQLAAAAPAVVLSCVVPVSTPAEAQYGNVAGIYYKDDLIAEPMRLVDGAIELPHGVGMGIAVDETKVRRYALKSAPGV